MRLGRLAECSDEVPETWVREPERRLPTQDANFSVDHARHLALALSLARDDQNHPGLLSVSAVQEVMDSLMRVREASTMQIDPGVDLKASLGQLTVLATIDSPKRPQRRSRSRGMVDPRAMIDRGGAPVFDRLRGDHLARIARAHSLGDGSPKLPLFG